MRLFLFTAFSLSLHAEALVQHLQFGDLSAQIVPYIVASGDISDPRYSVPRGSIGDPVAGLLLRTDNFVILCGGALLPNGTDILTAAHCVTDAFGHLNILGGTATFFPSTGGSQIIGVSGAQAFPGYNGDLTAGNDLAVIHLQSPVSSAIPRTTLYTASDETGKTYNVVGFGLTGSFGLGETGPAGVRHRGSNQFDATLGDIGFGSPNILLSDFDDGTPQHDAFGVFFGIDGLGLGLDEVSIALGDSGSPAFVNGQVAGITSFGLQFNVGPVSSDIDGESNGSFGEFNGFTRVSPYDDWITGPHNFNLVPEPATWLLCLIAFIVTGFARLSYFSRRSRHQTAR